MEINAKQRLEAAGRKDPDDMVRALRSAGFKAVFDASKSATGIIRVYRGVKEVATVSVKNGAVKCSDPELAKSLKEAITSV
jgi:hypothetical protein